MTTARTIIEKALKKNGVLGRGQTLNNDEAQDALDTLNDMLQSWSVEGGMIYTQTRETFSLTGATSYTIGSGGNFNTTRPFEIEALYVSSGGVDYTCNQIDQKQYATIDFKTTSGVPDVFYYDNNSPLGNLFLYPLDNASYTITIYSRKPLTSFDSLTTDVTLPEGYERGIVLNLSVEMCSDYDKEPSMTLKEIAGIAKGNIFTYNSRNDNDVSTVDVALLSGTPFNIYGGT